MLAAAGARVTSFDLSDAQLRRDRAVAEREGLALRCVQGDMRDLSVFADASFDLVFNATSIVFVPDPVPVWRECHRVLKPRGVLLAGFMNPAYYLFDHEAAQREQRLVVTHRLPYREPDDLAPSAKLAWEQRGHAAEFGHTLEALIGTQLAAGFVLTALYEDSWNDAATPLNRYMQVNFATRAEKRAVPDQA